MPWVPVWMAAGIGLWFLLPAQPGVLANGLAAFAALCGLALWRLRLDIRMADTLRVAGLALILLALGILIGLIGAIIGLYRFLRV